MKNNFINISRNIKYLPIRLKLFIMGYNIGKNFIIGRGVNIEREGFIAGNNVYIGQYSYIGSNTKIADFCMLSDNVNIIGEDHSFETVGTPIILSGRPKSVPCTILEKDVWIGHGVTIMRGITIGEGSIIGANSVVTKNIKSYSIYAGVPAKKIRKRFKNESERVKHSQIINNLG